MKFIPVEPIGQYTTPAFVDFAGGKPGEMRNITVPEYPPTIKGEALRLLRLNANLTLRGAAARLQISPAELSKLECGKLTLSDQDWAMVFTDLAE